MVDTDISLRTKLNKLASYASQGKWNTVVEFASHYRTASVLAVQPQQQRQQDAELAFTTYKVLALMRLRRFSLAGDELAQLGDLPAEQLTGDNVQETVPFGLLYLRAQLPAFLDQPLVTLDLLHQLRDYCQQQRHTWRQRMQNDTLPDDQHHRQQLQQQHQETTTDIGTHDQNMAVDGNSHSPSDSKQSQAAEHAALWQQRLHTVTCSLILHHWQQNDIITSFKLLDQQLHQQPDSVQLWSLAGRLQLQLQMNQQAHNSFSKVQQLVQQQQVQYAASAAGAAEGPTPQHLPQLQQLVHHNWGCYHALTNNMKAAVDEFNSAQQICSSAAIAATAAPDSSIAAVTSDPLAAAAAAGAADVAAEGAPRDRAFAGRASAILDGVSVSNAAVCLLHMGQLTEAISAVEAGIMQDPDQLLHECTLFNLGMMYDLAYPPLMAEQTRLQLAGSVRRFAADDLDLSCIERGC